MKTNPAPYSYSFNNPLSYKDPSGLAPEKEKGGGMKIQGPEWLLYFESCKQEAYETCMQSRYANHLFALQLHDKFKVENAIYMAKLIAFGIDGLGGSGGGKGKGSTESGNGTRTIYSLSKNIFFLATKKEANRLAQGLAKSLNATYSIDENNNINFDYCDLDFEKDESILQLELRNRFENMKNEKKPLYLSFGDKSDGWGSEFAINKGYLNNDFVKDIGYFNFENELPASFESALVHEFFGHGGEHLLNKYSVTEKGVEQNAVIWENYWHIINNEPIRTKYGYPKGREITIPNWQLYWKKH